MGEEAVDSRVCSYTWDPWVRKMPECALVCFRMWSRMWILIYSTPCLGKVFVCLTKFLQPLLCVKPPSPSVGSSPAKRNYFNQETRMGGYPLCPSTVGIYLWSRSVAWFAKIYFSDIHAERRCNRQACAWCCFLFSLEHCQSRIWGSFLQIRRMIRFCTIQDFDF